MRDRVRQSIIVSAGAAALAIALGIAIPALADDRESAESHHAQQQPFVQIQARMQSMHALMTEINRTTDPAARQQLMVQQMQLMRAQMHDMGMMNRKLFFNLFERLRIRYRDISGMMGITTRKDASLSSGAVADTLNSLLAEEPSPEGPGPLLLLMDDTARVAVAERVLPPLLEPRPRGGWQVQFFKTQ